MNPRALLLFVFTTRSPARRRDRPVSHDRVNSMRSVPTRAVASACAACAALGLSLPIIESPPNQPPASIKLTAVSMSVGQTSDTEWTLDKTGWLSGNTVTWDITATQGATVPGRLVLLGQMTVTNTGSGPATIGNIVVNLQKRVGNTWVSASANVANATDGDAAITADIHAQASSESLSTFTENIASGELEFMDATNNTVWALEPPKLVEGGDTLSLLFQASFDNNVLGLANGTLIRSEVIVSFGNSTNGGNSTSNVDINGNGVIDTDEARVRSVPSRLTVAVPAPVPGNSMVTLTDTVDDIATTGTVTFSNAVFNLGATSGTVTATVDGGTDGGTITNCAHLTSGSSSVVSGGFTFPVVNGLDLTDCSTVDVGASTCTPGAPGCGWRDGDIVTYPQALWGSASSAAGALLLNYFFSIYTAGEVEIGVPGAAGFSAVFTSGSAIVTYLPAVGTPAPLNNDLIDPSTTSSGSFGGTVLALALNVDASGLTGGSSGVAFGNLSLCNMAPASLNGTSVASFLGLVNTLLGGGSNGYSIDELAPIADTLNDTFVAGAVSSFAQDHLVNGPCP